MTADYETRRWEHACHPEDAHLVDITVAIAALRALGREAFVPRAAYHDHPDLPYRSVVVQIPEWLSVGLRHTADIGHFQASVNMKLLNMASRTAGSRLNMKERYDQRLLEYSLMVRADLKPGDEE